MLGKLLPTVEDIPLDTVTKPTRRSLAALPDPEPLPPELTEREVERSKAVAAHSGFGQSHGAPAKTKPAPKTEPVAERMAPDTGRMMRRSKHTELMSTRVQPDTLRFLRDYANEHDMTFASVVEHVVHEFRKTKGF